MTLAAQAARRWSWGDTEGAIEALRRARVLDAFKRALPPDGRPTRPDVFRAFAAADRVERARIERRAQAFVAGPVWPVGQALKGGILQDLPPLVDPFCPNVDIDAFKRDCRVPVFPNRWQIWKLQRTDRDNPTPADIERTARAVVVAWFRSALFGEQMGDADHVEVLPSLPAGFRRVAKRGDCRHPMTVRAREPITVFVRFVYRGTRTDLPWPVHRAQVINPWCPIDADWIVDEVYEEPAGAADVPAPPSVPELVRPDVNAIVDVAKRGAAVAAKAAEGAAGVGTNIGLAIAGVLVLGLGMFGFAHGFGAGLGGRQHARG